MLEARRERENKLIELQFPEKVPVRKNKHKCKKESEDSKSFKKDTKKTKKRKCNKESEDSRSIKDPMKTKSGKAKA